MKKETTATPVVQIDKLAEEYLSEKTIQDIQGIELYFATTEQGAIIKFKMPWRALRRTVIAACVIWPILDRGGGALVKAIGKIFTS